ncbi:MAG: MFS transporter [Pirellulaceae bacterium]
MDSKQEGGQTEKTWKAGRAFEPLRIPAYRSFWIAGLVSNLGTWMHETGAQWQMTSLDPSPEMVSAVRTAMTIPVFCLALPAGVWADWFDKRLWLLSTQMLLFVIATCMALMAGFGLLTPWPLLLLTAAMGIGMVLNQPAWQSLTPELVPPALIPSAVSVGSMSFNLARSLGPALAGLLIAQLGIWCAFLFNAFSFLAVVFALLVWRPDPESTSSNRPKKQSGIKPLGFWSELQMGLFVVRTSKEVRNTLIRLCVFASMASILWSLLALVATQKLGYRELGFGSCLAIIGTGAVLGAVFLPRVRLFVSSERIVLTAQIAFGVLCLLIGYNDSPLVILPALVLIGLSWMTTMTTLNATAQVFLPRQYRARGMSAYMMAFAFGMGIGSASWGWLAQAYDLSFAFKAAGLAMVMFAICLHPLQLGSLFDRENDGENKAI